MNPLTEQDLNFLLTFAKEDIKNKSDKYAWDYKIAIKDSLCGCRKK